MANVIGNKTVVVTPSDTVDNPAGTFFPCVDVSGHYKMDLAGDAAGTGVTRYMLAGVLYSYAVKRLYITGSDGGTMTGLNCVSTG